MKGLAVVEARRARREADISATPAGAPVHEPDSGAGGVVLRWERVDSIGDWRPDDYSVAHVAFYRARVPGGWLIASKGSYQATGMGLTFYPDPLHAWQG